MSASKAICMSWSSVAFHMQRWPQQAANLNWRFSACQRFVYTSRTVVSYSYTVCMSNLIHFVPFSACSGLIVLAVPLSSCWLPLHTIIYLERLTHHHSKGISVQHHLPILSSFVQSAEFHSSERKRNSPNFSLPHDVLFVAS